MSELSQIIENCENDDLKDVACIVFSQTSERDCSSIYLVDTVKEKIRGIVDMYRDEYPFRMGYVVYKRMLYMFGGRMVANPVDKLGCNNAYVLDLFEVARTYAGNDKQKPPVPPNPIELLPSMISGKYAARAVVVGDKICVFDAILGYRPADCSFEIFDPKLKEWVGIPDPFLLEPGHFVTEFYVEDDKLFLSFGDKGIYALTFGVPSPFWVHHKSFHGVSRLPRTTRGVKIGDIVLTLDEAIDLADDRGGGFAWSVTTTRSGVTAEESYKVDWDANGPIFLVGPTTVCSVKALLVHNSPRPKRKLRSDTKSSSLVLHKCDDTSRKGYKLLVNVYDVDPAARPIKLKVVRSFMVPLEIDYAQFRTGYFLFCAGCDP